MEKLRCEASRRGNAKTRKATGLRDACQEFAQRARGIGWSLLWIGVGLWAQAGICAEELAVDLAETLERRRKPQAVLWAGRGVNGLWERLIRVVRRCQPGVAAWRRLAARIDASLTARCDPASDRTHWIGEASKNQGIASLSR